MIRVYLAWLDLLGVSGPTAATAYMIHETADVGGRRALLGRPRRRRRRPPSSKTTLKKHNPKTVRKNVGEDYHGCLVIRVCKAPSYTVASKAGGTA